jgi:hypothetical protein
MVLVLCSKSSTGTFMFFFDSRSIVWINMCVLGE